MGLEFPYGGTSAARLAAMASEANGYEFVPDVNVRFGPPEVCTDGISNSKVKMYAIEDAGYDREAEFFYDRLPLDALTSASACLPGRVNLDTVPFSIHQILPLFNQVYRTDISPDEVEDEVFTERRDKYPLRIKDDVSLGWISSGFEFPVKWPFGTTLDQREEVMDRLHILVHQGLPDAMAEG